MESSSEQPLNEVIFLAEYELTKKALDEAKSKLQEVINENRQLTEERDASHRDSYQVAEFLRRELQEKTTSIERMQLLVQTIRDEAQIEISDARQHAIKEVEDARQSFRKREQQLEAKVSTLQTELQELRSFRERQKEIEDVLYTFQQDKKKLEEEFELERTKLEKNFFEETNRLRREFEHQLTQQKRIAETEQEQYLDDRVKDILKQNRRLAMELNLHKQVLYFALVIAQYNSQETTELHRELRLCDDERLRLSKELEFRVSLEEGFAERNARQRVQLHATQSKSESLEKSMKQLVVNMTKITEERKRKSDNQLEDLKLEAEALRKMVKAKNRECLTLRHLSQQILIQRKEVERFLITSIHLARKERAQKESQKMDEVSPAETSVEEMTWLEREHVLKILLSKLQTGTKLKTSEAELVAGILSKEGPAKPT